MTTPTAPVALITGGSSGLGLALTHLLDRRGWTVVTDARHGGPLRQALSGTLAEGIPGDVRDPAHRAVLSDCVAALGGLDLLVLNASTLGPVPLRPLTDLSPGELESVLGTNASAHAALMTALVEPLRRRRGVVVAISSDAAVQHYETWGAYGASKAALDHLVLTFGAETGLTTYAVDPGDMHTPMHAAAAPDDDVAGLADPEEVAPRLLALVRSGAPTGRYLAAEVDVFEEATA